ncbi:MAG: hypothetical protein CSA10_01035 [Cardiobacteriales bacterium]|nr:MAG: hypothetical protein CSA10_01035 [Cardiobacteriales bacterium]
MAFSLTLNGEILQKADGSYMLFPIAKQIAHISQFCILTHGAPQKVWADLILEMKSPLS